MYSKQYLFQFFALESSPSPWEQDALFLYNFFLFCAVLCSTEAYICHCLKTSLFPGQSHQEVVSPSWSSSVSPAEGAVVRSSTVGRTPGFCSISFWANGMMLSGRIHPGPITVSDVTTSVGLRGNGVEARGPPLADEERKTDPWWRKESFPFSTPVHRLQRPIPDMFEICTSSCVH